MLRRLVVLTVCLLAFAAPAAGVEQGWRHALSLMGEPKYQPGFQHFDYVNPNAPKGGAVRLGGLGGFDSFNLVVAGVKGELEDRLPLIYDTLMSSAFDEVNTEYGLIAEAVRYPEDYSSVTYRLRPEGRWHDGKPITAEDVIFTFDALKANSAFYAAYWRNVTKAEKSGERDVTFAFNETGNRELPQIVGQMPVLPKHYWEGTDASGRKRNITETTLEPPLGSGPYRLKSFEAGRVAVYERVPDYWAKDLPVSRGGYNFDEIRTEYFRDTTVLLEAFKADRIDFRSENSAKNWATAYDFPAVQEGRVVKEEFPINSAGVMQAFVFNLRREKFADERVRRAFNLAFDFEEINRTLFYGQYQRIDSYFFGIELASAGLPDGREKEVLQSLGEKVPAEVFSKPYANPVNGTPENVRANLREAVRLLAESGYVLKGTRLVSKKTGEHFTLEFLGFDPNAERYLLPYKQALERIGIGVTVRIVDSTQYQNRLRSFDFDVTTTVWPQSLSPGNEQRDFWGSAAADRPGSRNLAGIKDEVIDALIERIIYAKDRDELEATTKALDRMLLAHNYVVPHWSYRFERTARWDRFGRPKVMPEYAASAFPTIWWSREVERAKTGAVK